MTGFFDELEAQLQQAAQARVSVSAPSGARRRWRPNVGLLATALLVAVTLVIAAGALVLLRGGPRPASTPTDEKAQRLLDILAVLRRPQTQADRALPERLVQGLPGIAAIGTPELRLARLATITPWGQNVFIVPIRPLTAAEAVRLERRYPGTRSLIQQSSVRTVQLALLGPREESFSSVSDIENGRAEVFDGAHSILGLAGQGPPIRVVMVIPDGVARVTFILPRQANPGAIAYPNTQTITVRVHDNIAAFQTDRYINEDRLSRIAMTWYAPSGAIVKRLGDFSQLTTVRPDPTVSSRALHDDASKWAYLAIVPSSGGPTTTFTAAFRRPLSGAHRYTFRFTGPVPHAGCYSPVGAAPITRGPDLGIPSTQRGQIANTQFSAQRWCSGTYRVTVAVVASSDRPFSATSFTVRP